MDRKISRNNQMVIISGIACLIIALYQVILLVDYGVVNGSGGGLSYLRESGYIPEVFYIFTCLYIIINMVTGILLIRYAQKPGKGIAIFVLGLIYLVLKANSCIFADLLFISIKRFFNDRYIHAITIIINAIPFLLMIPGGIQKYRSYKKIRSEGLAEGVQ